MSSDGAPPGAGGGCEEAIGAPPDGRCGGGDAGEGGDVGGGEGEGGMGNSAAMTAGDGPWGMVAITMPLTPPCARACVRTAGEAKIPLCASVGSVSAAAIVVAL